MAYWTAGPVGEIRRYCADRKSCGNLHCIEISRWQAQWAVILVEQEASASSTLLEGRTAEKVLRCPLFPVYVSICVYLSVIYPYPIRIVTYLCVTVHIGLYRKGSAP